MSHVTELIWLVTRSCVYVHGECVARNSHTGLLLVALGLVSAAIVYGVVFVRRGNVRPLMHVVAPALAVVAGAVVVVLAYSW
ncbi:MAG: hypothetical protein ABI862_07065 [Ilumatobacteraceae bacterium]